MRKTKGKAAKAVDLPSTKQKESTTVSKSKSIANASRSTRNSSRLILEPSSSSGNFKVSKKDLSKVVGRVEPGSSVRPKRKKKRASIKSKDPDYSPQCVEEEEIEESRVDKEEIEELTVDDNGVFSFSFLLEERKNMSVESKGMRFLMLLIELLESKPIQLFLRRFCQFTIVSHISDIKRYVVFCGDRDLDNFQVDGLYVYTFLRQNYLPYVPKSSTKIVITTILRQLHALKFLHLLNTIYDDKTPSEIPNYSVISNLLEEYLLDISIANDFTPIEILEGSPSSSHPPSPNYERLIKMLYEQSWNDPRTNLKYIMDLTLQTVYLFSNDQKTRLRLPDIYVRQSNSSMTPVLYISSRWGQNLQSASFSETGSPRHRSILTCPFTIVGLWFFYEFDIKETPPDFRSNKSCNHLFYSKDTEIHYISHYHQRLLRYCSHNFGVSLNTITEIIETKKSQGFTFYEVDSNDENSSEGIIRDLLRDKVVPPLKLQEMVFPWLDREIQTIAELNTQENGKFRSCLSFLQLLKYLRITILQDLVVLNEKIPVNYFANSTIVRCDQFKEFKTKLLASQGSHDLESITYDNFQNVNKFEVINKLSDSIIERTIDIQDTINKQEVSKILESISFLTKLIENMHKPEMSLRIEPVPDVSLSAGNNISRRLEFVNHNANYFSSQYDDNSSYLLVTLAEEVVVPCDLNWKMNRNLFDVLEVMLEWYYNVPLNVALMDSKYGSSWRNSSYDTAHYLRRKSLIDFIDHQAKSFGISSWEVAKELENFRNYKSYSLKKLTNVVFDKGKRFVEFQGEFERAIKIIIERYEVAISYVLLK